jgi:endonuclease YncB( thermonuclease family)
MTKINRKKTLSSLLLIIFLFSFFYWIFVAIKSPNKTPPIQGTSFSKPLTQKTIFGKAKIIDGDTIIINGKRIRLIGIDTPETKQKCLDENNFEYWCGNMATNFLKKLIGNKKVKCIWQEKDVYKRYLGSCKLGKININHEMVKSGMAVIYNLKEASEDLKKLETDARNKQLGIWKGAFEEPKKYRKKNRR